MTEQSQPFRVVLRGYDTAQVDQRLAELAQAAAEARAGADELAQRVRVLEAERERAASDQEAAADADTPATPLTFDHLGPRVVQILSLAEEEAEQQASSIVTEARTSAARVRAESERELAAASQRRDSINAQLANVRQMLATLTGGSAGASLVEQALAEPAAPAEPDDEPEAPAEVAVETEVAVLEADAEVEPADEPDGAKG